MELNNNYKNLNRNGYYIKNKIEKNYIYLFLLIYGIIIKRI
jgi:hypothetical protein